MKYHPEMCNKCKFYVYSTTLGSPDVPIFHCRYGFRSYRDSKGSRSCRTEAKRNLVNSIPRYKQLEICF